MEINMGGYVYLTGAPTSGGGIDYYYNKDKKMILEIGYPDTYDEPIFVVNEIPLKDAGEWLQKMVKNHTEGKKND